MSNNSDANISWDEENVNFDDAEFDVELEENKISEGDILLNSISNSFDSEEFLNSSLKKWFSGILLSILAISTLVICTIIVLQGLSIIRLKEWTLRIFITGVFVEIIAVVKIIVTSIFPADDRKIYLDFIKTYSCKKK